jgi:hypothetical protein
MSFGSVLYARVPSTEQEDESHLLHWFRRIACDLQCYDEMCALDALNFFQWASDDERIVGLAPWNWTGCPECAAIHDEIGTLALNMTVTAWQLIGQQIKQQALARSA